jgi:hypothetical protein
METQVLVPLNVRIDAAHGGRWTSLSGGGREWLWHRHEPRRDQVRVGDAFADAGGLEECAPTVRGTPDHGDAWSRAWAPIGGEGLEHVVGCTDFELTRRISVDDGAVVADYRVSADPGYRFVWAGHALLDVSSRARVEMDLGTKVRLFPEAASLLRSPWPDGAAWVEGDWPAPAGVRLDTLGPDDGSAVGAVAYSAGSGEGMATALVVDGPDLLRVTVQADDQPAAIALWRNLGGFPQPGPYRSIGVEPMLGRVFDLAEARDGECAVTPTTGEVRWRLTITSFRRTERN